jgi:hypothetical protein
MELLVFLPTVQTILGRVVELDKQSPPARADFAALPHLAFGMLYSAAGAQLGGKPAEAKAEFEAALKASADKAHPDGRFLLARAFLAYRVGLMTNDRKLFHDQLKQVLETPPSVWPEQRLANEVAHRRARRYLSHEKELFQ